MDLDRALAEDPPPTGARLRVHFHTPLHWRGRGPLAGTAARTLPPLLARGELLPPVLEVETYTWSVLPGKADLEEGIAAELAWARRRLAGSEWDGTGGG